MKKGWIFFLVVALLPTISFAGPHARKKAPESEATDPLSPNQGSDSCGPGWKVNNNRSLLGTVTRGSTNSFVAPFAMTSGTWGCDKHSFAKKDQEAVIYAATNIEPLTNEMAEGRGEFLQGFARTLGCSDAVVGAFGEMTQRHYEQLTNVQNGVELFENVKKAIGSDPLLAVGCNLSV